MSVPGTPPTPERVDSAAAEAVSEPAAPPESASAREGVGEAHSANESVPAHLTALVYFLAPHVRGQEQVLKIANHLWVAGFRRVAEDPEQPELITSPVFTGCNNTNPDYCACGDAPWCCDACGDEIDEGVEVYMARFPLYQWMPPDSPGQEWETQYWHTNCDLRAALRGGEQK